MKDTGKDLKFHMQDSCRASTFAYRIGIFQGLETLLQGHFKNFFE